MYQDMSFKEISESTGQHQHRFRSNALCFDEFAKSYRQASNCFDQLTISLSFALFIKENL
jgi:hypothetical protein